MFARLHQWLHHLKSVGLGGLWAVLGLNSSKPWVSGFLVGMSVVHFLWVVTGAMARRGKKREETPHIGGGINSSINAEMVEAR